jgi:alpha-L-fucosidase
LLNSKDELVKEIHGTTMGNKRIITFPAVNISTIEIIILQQDGPTAVTDIEGYYIEEDLTEK